MRSPNLMRLAPLSAAVVATSSLLHSGVQAQMCAVPANTLSLSCGAACDEFSPCMRKSNSSSSCDLECFTIDSASPSSYMSFTFLIPYNPSAVGDTETTAFKSNAALTKIAKLPLPSVTTSDDPRQQSARERERQSSENRNHHRFSLGKPAGDAFAAREPESDADARQTRAKFPAGVAELWIGNLGLKAFPSEVKTLKGLTILFLNDNYIPLVDSSHEMSQLTSLHLDVNSIASFTAVFLSLTYLDLAYNNLKEVPAVIPKRTKLRTLHLSGNAIPDFKQEQVAESIETLDISSNKFTEFLSAIFNHSTLKTLNIMTSDLLTDVTLTNEQADFIYTLDKFTADPAAFSSKCDASQKTKVQGFTVCITGGKVDLSVIQGARPSSTWTPQSSSSSSAGDSKTTSGGGSKSSSPSVSDSGSKTGTGTVDMQSSSSSNSTTTIILSCIAGVLAVALVAGFVYLKKRNKQENSGKQDTTTVAASTAHSGGVSGGGTTGSKSDHQQYSSLWNDPDLLSVKLDANDIQDISKIGQGALSDVWLVQYRGSQRLASKRLRQDEISRSRTQDFIKEIRLVATLNHSRIVEFVGVAWTKEADLQALFELMENGDLRTYPVDEQTARSWTLEKVQIAIDIAEALAYVHSLNPPLVHRDLKSRNVLLNSKMQAKLKDFGVTRYQPEENTMTAGVGTCKWLAPEVILEISDYGPAADVYSFGVVLSELDSHRLPYEDGRGQNGNKLVDVALLQRVSTGELRPSFLPTCPPKITKLAELCLSLRPEDRPSSIEITYALRTFKKKLSGGFSV